MLDLREERVAPREHERAALDVAVAADVLRRRVEDDVGSERERALERRRRERVVHEDERAGLARDGDGGREIGDLHQRVRRRLEPDELRLRPDRRAQRRQIVHRREVRTDAPGAKEIECRNAKAVVDVVGEDQRDLPRRASGEPPSPPPCPRRTRAPPRRLREARALPRGAPASDSPRGCTGSGRGARSSRRARTSSRSAAGARSHRSPDPRGVRRGRTGSRASSAASLWRGRACVEGSRVVRFLTD